MDKIKFEIYGLNICLMKFINSMSDSSYLEWYIIKTGIGDDWVLRHNRDIVARCVAKEVQFRFDIEEDNIRDISGIISQSFPGLKFNNKTKNENDPLKFPMPKLPTVITKKKRSRKQ